MRPLIANTEKCCFPEAGEDTGAMVWVLSGLKTLVRGTELEHAAAIGRPAR